MCVGCAWVRVRVSSRCPAWVRVRASVEPESAWVVRACRRLCGGMCPAPACVLVRACLCVRVGGWVRVGGCVGAPRGCGRVRAVGCAGGV